MKIFIMTFYDIYRFVSPVLMFYKSRHCWIKQVYERNDMQFEALICLYFKKKIKKDAAWVFSVNAGGDNTERGAMPIWKWAQIVGL